MFTEFNALKPSKYPIDPKQPLDLLRKDNLLIARERALELMANFNQYEEYCEESKERGKR